MPSSIIASLHFYLPDSVLRLPLTILTNYLKNQAKTHKSKVCSRQGKTVGLKATNCGEAMIVIGDQSIESSILVRSFISWPPTP